VSLDQSPPYGFTWSFVALEYYAGILNRVYLLLVGDRVLAGAYMRRQDGPAIRDRLLPSTARASLGADEAVPRAVFDPFRPLFAPGS
jgi:hypothetical protein